MGIDIPKSIDGLGADRFAAAGGGGGGGGGGGVTGWTRLTPDMCSDHYSSGGADGYSGTANVTLTDDGTKTSMRNNVNIQEGGYGATVTRRFSVWWHDTGISIADVSAIEVSLEWVGSTPNAANSNRKPAFGIMVSTSYLNPHRDNWHPLPEHYVSCLQYQSGADLYPAVMVDDESMAGSGLPSSWAKGAYAVIPIYEQAIAGGNPAGVIRYTTRDITLRKLGDGGGGVNVTNAARDTSTWFATGRYWETGTVKIGIVRASKDNNLTHLAGEGLDFKIHFKVADGGRIAGRV
jgi:hypothetical protein